MATEHIVSSFDEELKGLGASIAEMGGRAERLVDQSVTALIRGDDDLAQEVISADVAVDEMERDITDRAILVIAKRQPVAQDLRETVAAIRISNDLERVADLAKNIARRTIAINGKGYSRIMLSGVEHQAKLVLKQLKDVLDAYASRDNSKARQVWDSDEEIDVVYTSLFRELLTYMMEDPRNITMCAHLLFCAKNLERIGDHATNIAEEVHYVATGDKLEDPRPRGANAI